VVFFRVSWVSSRDLYRVSWGRGGAVWRTQTPITNPGQDFTVTTAAAACRVSRKTVLRRIDRLQEGGAYKDDVGAWVIPLRALLHAGFTPGRPSSPDTGNVPQEGTQGHQGHGGDKFWVTPEEVAELRKRAEESETLRRRAEVAEALAAERERVIGVQARALRMLESGQRAPAAAETTSEASVPVPSVPASVPRNRGPLERLVGRFGL
jgi:hypothetical protein